MSNLILPTNMSRRGFLRSIGVTAAVVAVPKLWTPEPAIVTHEISVPLAEPFYKEYPRIMLTWNLDKRAWMDPEGRLYKSMFRCSPDEIGRIAWIG